MPKEITVATLAMELRASRREMKETRATLKEHVDGCGELQKETAAKLDGLRTGLDAINDRFAKWDRITDFFSRRGKWLAGAVISALLGAWASVLAQNYLLHRETAQTATVAATAATSAAEGQKTVIHKLQEIAPGP